MDTQTPTLAGQESQPLKQREIAQLQVQQERCTTSEGDPSLLTYCMGAASHAGCWGVEAVPEGQAGLPRPAAVAQAHGLGSAGGRALRQGARSLPAGPALKLLVPHQGPADGHKMICAWRVLGCMLYGICCAWALDMTCWSRPEPLLPQGLAGGCVSG